MASLSRGWTLQANNAEWSVTLTKELRVTAKGWIIRPWLTPLSFSPPTATHGTRCMKSCQATEEGVGISTTNKPKKTKHCCGPQLLREKNKTPLVSMVLWETRVELCGEHRVNISTSSVMEAGALFGLICCLWAWTAPHHWGLQGCICVVHWDSDRQFKHQIKC